jgi:predicted peptidase
MPTVALVLGLVGAGFDTQFSALFTAKEFHYTGAGYHDELFRYQIMIPSSGPENGKWPLVVWLHGIGESGRDNIRHLLWLEHTILGPPWDRSRYPFFLLAVQCPWENSGWICDDKSDKDDMVNVVAAIVKQTLKEYPIDADRVCATGISSGGKGVWAIAERHAELFAGIAPCASGGAYEDRFDVLTKVPVWAFNATADGEASIEDARRTMAALYRAGGIGCLTEVESESHDCWTTAFNEYHLLDWLLAQRRGHSSWCDRPGHVPWSRQLEDAAGRWQWWQIPVQIAIPLVFAVIIRRMLRRKPRRL